MRHLSIVGIITMMLTLVPSLLFAETVIDNSKNPDYLFVISGMSGSLDGDTLTLNGVPSVIYFSDRPARIAGHMRLSKWVGIWDKEINTFKKDPPNATLSIFTENGTDDIVIELQNPTVKENGISFKIRTLRGTAPKQFKESSLFIDYGNGGSGGVGGN